MQGELRVGDQLPSERELSELFGVSRTAVRDAVNALREKGLVEVRPGKGTFIADIADRSLGVVRDSLGLMVGSMLDKGLADLIQVRTILEPEIAAIAAACAREEDLETLQSALDTMESALDDADVFIESDLEFHLALAKATQNPLIPVLIDPIIDLLRDHRWRMSMVEGGSERGQYHHRRIFSAVLKRDPAAARKAMTAHMEQVVQDSSALQTLAD
jgi:GntR family transcriptional repressor for pyruvate dehydrogenase complex